MKLFGVVIFLLIGTFTYSQTITQAALQKQGILISDSDYQKLAPFQLKIISDYNFVAFRNYSSIREIALVNGPTIRLSSLSDLMSQGIIFTHDVIEHKKNEQTNNNLHSIITRVDVGLNYKPKSRSERDGN